MVRSHRAEADREEHTAIGLDRRVTSRDHHQQVAMETNQSYATRREALIATVEADRATITRNRDIRPSEPRPRPPTKWPPPTRPAPPTWKARQHRLVGQREQTLRAHQQPPIPPPIERGPSMEM